VLTFTSTLKVKLHLDKYYLSICDSHESQHLVSLPTLDTRIHISFMRVSRDGRDLATSSLFKSNLKPDALDLGPSYITADIGELSVAKSNGWKYPCMSRIRTGATIS
jgi:hypothetical protein